VSVFGWLLLVLLAGILLVDYARLRQKGSRTLAVESVVFGLGALLIVFPGISQSFARLSGVGRGADLVIYLLLVLLVREALGTRERQWTEARRQAELVRAIAVTNVQRPSRR
jgi:small membrane protein